MEHSRAIRTLHVLRVGLFGVLLLSILLAQMSAASLPITRGILAFATSMSRGELLAATNSARAANGVGALAENAQLNNSAQAKAQHMVDNNYWAHTAPDGTQPWYFFTNAGYNYQAAGENLAYGFPNAQEVVNGWMASASHRANMLRADYVDVGFGFVNGSSYQGGQYTVVVGHYAKPVPAPAPPPPTTPAPTPAPAATPTPSAQPTPSTATPTPQSTPTPTPTPTQTTPEPTPNSEPTPSTPAEEKPAKEPQKNPAPTNPNPVQETTNESVRAYQKLLEGEATPTLVASVTSLGVAVIGFGVTHRELMRRSFIIGERFLFHHPVLDFLAILITAAIILFSTVARI